MRLTPDAACLLAQPVVLAVAIAALGAACGARTALPDPDGVAGAQAVGETEAPIAEGWEWAPSTVAESHPRALAPDIDVAHYEIELDIDHETRGFAGAITMRAQVVGEPIACVRMHAAPSLEVHEVTLREVVDSGTPRSVPTVIDRDGDVLSACFDGPLVAGYPFEVRTRFSGMAGDANDQRGLFAVPSESSSLPSFYTQFESQDARRALPLVDEPFDKATTTVHLTGDLRYTLLSNGEPVQCVSHNPGRQTCTWHNPDPIAPYLITFVAAELEEIESTYSRSDGTTIPLTVYTEPGHVADGLYAMYALERTLALYEAAYGLPFPWSRYGMVALPGFRYGGMENKGLTNIAADALYLDPSRTPIARRYRVFGITAHELAHEWFGNLVTMQWWDDVWLNEGFASYMTRLAFADEFDPTASALGDYVSLQRWYMDVERGPFAHPIVYEDWTSPGQLFDAISYTKGRKVLEMLEALLGRERLFAGIRRYLRENAGSNAATARFFATIEEESGHDLDGFVEPWLFEAGFPEVSFDPRWDADTGVLSIDVVQASSRGADHDAVWSFPIRIGFAGEGYALDQWFVVLDRAQTLEIDLPAEPHVVSVNRGGTALIDATIVGRGVDEWLRLAVEDDDAFGRGVALFELLELLADDWEADRSAVQARMPEVAAVFRAAVEGQGDGADALRAFALQRLNDGAVPTALRDALAAELLGVVTTLLGGPDPGDDVLAVDGRIAAIDALGRVDQVTSQVLLRSLAGERIDYVVPAVGGLLRTSSADRFDVLESALRDHADNRVIVHGLLGAVAAVPSPDILDRLRTYLADPTVVAPSDARAVAAVLGQLIGANPALAYSEEGMAFIGEVLEAELDRPGTLIRTLRRFQDAAERPPDDRARLAAMLDAFAATLAETEDTEQVGEVVRMLRASLE